MSTNTLELLSKFYPGKIFLSIENIATSIDLTTPSLRNLLSQKKIPLKTLKQGRRRVAHIAELARYIDDRNLTAKAPKKIGRPRKTPTLNIGGAK